MVCRFSFPTVDISAVIISPSGPITGTAGETFTLECSADIMTQSDSPSPTYEWFFGLTNTSLPSGVTVSNVTNSGNTYTSILQFSPLQESHAGMYTCRLGGNARLAVNTMITVNGMTFYLLFLVIHQTLSSSSFSLCPNHCQWSSSVGTK